MAKPSNKPSNKRSPVSKPKATPKSPPPKAVNGNAGDVLPPPQSPPPKEKEVVAASSEEELSVDETSIISGAPSLLNSSQKGKSVYMKKKKKKPNMLSFKRFIYRVLKSVHEDLSASSSAMTVMDNFVMDFFHRIVNEAAFLTKHKKARTLSSADIQSAVRLLIPGELCKNAVSEGSKAVTRFYRSK